MNIKFNSNNGAYYSLGDSTLQVPLALFALNRKRLVDELRKNTNSPNSIVVLKGGEKEFRGCSDFEPVFRQESYFHWAFGVLESAFYGAVRIADGKAILFFPRPTDGDIIFEGMETDPEVIRRAYEVDEVYFIDEMISKLQQWNPAELFILSGTNSGNTCIEADFVGIEDFRLNKTAVFEAMTLLRVFKTDMEVEVMRYANKISSEGHIKVLQTIRPGMSEFQTESTFLNYCYSVGGCRHVAYTSVCGSGANGAILHYNRNSRTIQDGDLCLYDMGAEYYCYASDITVTFPVNGRFTEDQKKIYNSVLEANKAIFEAARPGVYWNDMQRLSDRIILEQLTYYGILEGSVDAMFQANLHRTFCPHGVGHLLGIDVHDVGDQYAFNSEMDSDEEDRFSDEYNPSYKAPKNKMPQQIKAGMVFTIEPGCYFIDHLLDLALINPALSRFLVASEIARFRGFGGVRIEDNVLVISNGLERLTSVPKTVEEIEAVMAVGR